MISDIASSKFRKANFASSKFRKANQFGNKFHVAEIQYREELQRSALVAELSIAEESKAKISLQFPSSQIHFLRDFSSAFFYLYPSQGQYN